MSPRGERQPQRNKTAPRCATSPSPCSALGPTSPAAPGAKSSLLSLVGAWAEEPRACPHAGQDHRSATTRQRDGPPSRSAQLRPRRQALSFLSSPRGGMGGGTPPMHPRGQGPPSRKKGTTRCATSPSPWSALGPTPPSAPSAKSSRRSFVRGMGGETPPMAPRAKGPP